MVKQIMNKALERALKKAGIEGVALYKDGTEGYFYIEGVTDFARDVLDYADTKAIYIYAFNQISIDSWVDEISRIWDKALDEYEDSVKARNSRKHKSDDEDVVVIKIGDSMLDIDYGDDDDKY